MKVRLSADDAPLNRLITAKSTSGYFSGLDLAWAYDNFGNRESQTASGTSGVSLTQPESLSFTGNNNRADQFSYNADGDVTTGLSNSYLYDAEGRVCAVDSTLNGVTLYLYNAAGRRAAKGTGSFSCDMATNGFTLTHRYVLDLAGRQMTEYDGSTWAHTNVFADGQLLATYSSTGTPLTFALSDWLGTKRVQAKADGEFDMSFLSLPYGDQLANGTGATEQFFTGKVRDTESGNDYFGARYYSNAFGRWITPDWSAAPEAVPYANLDNPQSLNLYGYVGDNPLGGIDLDGHCRSGFHWVYGFGKAVARTFVRAYRWESARPIHATVTTSQTITIPDASQGRPEDAWDSQGTRLVLGSTCIRHERSG